ncbi:MAG: replication initiation factor domain-containing protein [Geobacteraceae bacterium]|nr:replication initiation factor domain-containing protein [Geobacteraceae bacterium]
MFTLSIHQFEFTLPKYTKLYEIPALFEQFFAVPVPDPELMKQPRGRHSYPDLYILKSEHGAELIAAATRSRYSKPAWSDNTTNITVHGYTFEQNVIDMRGLAKKVLEANGWGTGIDLAFDDLNDELDWHTIKTAFGWSYDRKKACYVQNLDVFRDRTITKLCRPTKNKKTGKMDPGKPRLLSEEGETIELGSKKSDTNIIIYTRRGHIRVELQLRNRDQATDLITRLAAGEDISMRAAELLRAHLNFVEPGKKRKGGRADCQWWLDFLNNAAPADIWTKPRTNKSPWYAPVDEVKKTENALIVSGNVRMTHVGN